MNTQGFDHIYVETHDWDRAVAFWQALGFELEFATDHGSGMLTHPDGGPTVFVAQQSYDDPLAQAVYLKAAADYAPPADVEVVRPFENTHWGTKVMIIRDPDGRHFRVEAPVE